MEALGLRGQLALPPVFGYRSDTLLTARRALPDGGCVQMAFDRPNKLCRVEGLADVIGRSGHPAAHAVKHAVFAAEQQDGQIAIVLVMAHHLTDLIPVHVWEENIKQHEVRLGIPDRGQRA